MIAQQDIPTQIVSIMMILLVLIVIFLQYRQNKEKIYWLIPVTVWMIHGLVFYSVLFAERLGLMDFSGAYTDWSSILRLHGYMTIFVLELARYIQGRKSHGSA